MKKEKSSLNLRATPPVAKTRRGNIPRGASQPPPGSRPWSCSSCGHSVIAPAGLLYGVGGRGSLFDGDHHVVLPEQVEDGVGKPCQYTVLNDDNDFTADDLYKLAYFLCYTYAGSNRSISCPAPVQYAHLATLRTRRNLLAKMDELISHCS
ncbi:hypothetical protein CDAR_114501 [Caerostris darwini]|uniref:Piwi domain-containing protein n=1 Tax=Caerostris darwini TaxID=1538125 RepID=A0AAV4R1L3_9ARAC|nr:hypothetical protein CDAR_114501 [Caerostris darwini]